MLLFKLAELCRIVLDLSMEQSDLFPDPAKIKEYCITDTNKFTP